MMKTVPLDQKPVLPFMLVELRELQCAIIKFPFLLHQNFPATGSLHQHKSMLQDIVFGRGKLCLLHLCSFCCLFCSPSQCNLKQLPMTPLHVLTSHFPFNPLQLDFRPRHFSETALVCGTRDRHIDKFRAPVSVPATLDLSAACNRSDHSILLEILYFLLGSRLLPRARGWGYLGLPRLIQLLAEYPQ